MIQFKKDPPRTALLDLTAAEYSQLTEPQINAITRLILFRKSHRVRYARLGMLCSTYCFLGVTGGYIFLVMQGHKKAALVLLGTNVLTFLGRFIKARL
jgi:hypothetical protein